ncbi:hypothetical protein Tco_1156600 [Tanacetum coccineum]
MTNKKVAELDAEFIKYKAEAKASMNALEKKIDDGIEKLEASIKAMKEESDVKLDAKFEELRQLILGTPPSQSTHVDHDPQITKVAANTAPYVPPIRRCYYDIRLELHNSNVESSTIMGKNLRPKYWDVEKFHKSIITTIKEEKNQEEEGQHTKGIQRRTWDPEITWLKILKEHLEDKVKIAIRLVLQE